MRVSVTTYSFNKLIESGEMTQFDCIAKAKSLGFDAIDFANILNPEGTTPEEYAKILADECKKVGLPVLSLTFAADFVGCNLEDEIKRVKKMVDVASVLGVEHIRHDVTASGCKLPFEKTLPITAKACRSVTEYAEGLGIRTTVENHGYFYQDSHRLEQLYTAVDHPNFGLLLDFGNFLCADEDSAQAVGRLAHFAFHVHAKDFHVKSSQCPNPGRGFFVTRGGNYLRGSIIGHGNVPVAGCLNALKRVGYSGDLTLEYEGMEEPFTALSIGLENLRSYIGEDFGTIS